MDSSKEFPPMSLCRWQRFRSMLRGFQLIAVACGVAVLAVAVPRDARAQPSSGWGAFLGYTYQWAKVTPRANGLTLPVETSVSQPPSGINGWVASVERSLPLSTVSWVGEVRGAYAAWNFRVDAAQIHQDASQYLLLTGLRFGEKAGGVRPFIDGLAGMARVSSSRAAITWLGLEGLELNSLPFSVTSPAVEAGAGLDVPIRQHIEARVRGSWLSTDLV